MHGIHCRRDIIHRGHTASPASGNLLPLDGEVLLIEDALAPLDANSAFDLLLEETNWRQEHAVLFGRRIALPRLTAWYGEHGYRYSGIHHRPAQPTPTLLALKSSIEEVAGTKFNSVLLNLYRNGQDSIGWHSDDEVVLGPEPEIASLSLGAERRFHFKHRASGERVSFDLRHGSCLIMRESCQACWQHQLPKTKRKVGPRINLTFRSIRG